MYDLVELGGQLGSISRDLASCHDLAGIRDLRFVFSYYELVFISGGSK